MRKKKSDMSQERRNSYTEYTSTELEPPRSGIIPPRDINGLSKKRHYKDAHKLLRTQGDKIS